MKTSTCLASTGALLALMAFKQHPGSTAVLKLLPTSTSSVKSTKGTKQAVAVNDVVAAANAFLATLSTAQQGSVSTAAQGAVLQPFNSTTVLKWSNLPCGTNCRTGLQFANMTTAQQTAALAVVKAATGTGSGEGYDETQQIRAADDYLNANGGGSGYGSGIYFIAFLGTPSTTGTWMLQFGGHHLATNITFGNGTVTGATPKFEGVEPLSFTSTGGIYPSGTTVAPLNSEASAMLAMIQGLSSTQQATAKLSTTFSDVVLGPGSDGRFPTTRVGIQCSQLSTAQQALVVAAMAPWVNDVDDVTAASLLNYYKSQLADTYISYSGTGQFTTNADYARIDGPNVWVEFVCQTGVVFRNNIHYHSIYRDRARDYGGNFYGTYTTTLGNKAAVAAKVFSAYPNPVASGQGIDVVLAETTTAKSTTYTLRNTMGQAVASGSFSGVMAKVPTTGLAAGIYMLTVQPAGETAVTSRLTLQ